jgi:hypothetical protein
VTCDDGSVHAVYNSFPDTNAMTAAFNRYATADNVKSGWCGSDWDRYDTYALTGSTLGLVMCYHDKDGNVWMDWTYDQYLIYGYASRNDSDSRALFRWWDIVGSRLR